MREVERDFSFYGFPFEIFICKSVVRRRIGEVREIDCSVSASRIAQMNKRCCGNGGERERGEKHLCQKQRLRSGS